MTSIRTIVAANPSAMTLDGTRTYLVGRTNVAVIDPGPELDKHQHAVADAVGDGVFVSILLTHSHPDHAAGTGALAGRLRAHGCETRVVETRNGQAIPTDAGSLIAMATPGHTPDHMSFWLAAERAVFCGDLLMGGMDTALVARPEGDLGLYLHSLQMLRDVDARIMYPAHGPPFDMPAQAIDNYVAHRKERLQQVMEGLKDGPLSADALIDEVYGNGLDVRVRHYAEAALEAYLAYLHEQGRVRLSAAGMWSLT